MNKDIIKAAVVVLILAIIALLAGSVFASQTPYKVICHHTLSNEVTLSFQNIQSWLGHLGTPHSGSTYDTNGVCSSPTPTIIPITTPTIAPTATPEPTVIPCDGCCEKECDTTPTPEVTPTAEPTPVQNVQEEHREGLSAPTFAMCADIAVTEVPTIWVTDGTPSDGKLTVHWGKNQYGFVDIRYSDDTNMDKYSLLKTENDGNEEIGHLTIGNHYNFQVRFRNGCTVGEWSQKYDPVA